MTDTVNPGVEGSDDPRLIEDIQRAYGRWIDPDDCRAILAVVRAWDAEQRRRRRLSGPVLNVMVSPPPPTVIREVYERHPDGSTRRIR